MCSCSICGLGYGWAHINTWDRLAIPTYFCIYHLCVWNFLGVRYFLGFMLCACTCVHFVCVCLCSCRVCMLVSCRVRVLVFMLCTCACIHVLCVCLFSCCVRVLVFMLRACACVHVAVRVRDSAALTN